MKHLNKVFPNSPRKELIQIVKFTESDKDLEYVGSLNYEIKGVPLTEELVETQIKRAGGPKPTTYPAHLGVLVDAQSKTTVGAYKFEGGRAKRTLKPDPVFKELIANYPWKPVVKLDR